MIAYVDIEASGLHDGYPIEVAWCAADLSAGSSWLIRPDPIWRETLVWDDLVEDLHGLTLADLERHGRPAAEVAAALHADLRDASAVLSDSPAYDRAWLRQLYDLCDVGPPPALADAEASIATAYNLPRWCMEDLDHARGRFSRAAGLRDHRALDDAVWLAGGYALAMHMDEVEVVARARALLAAHGRKDL